MSAVMFCVGRLWEGIRMRRILITNDDGIEADGILRLVRTAKEFGEVWVVAPKEQMSAVSRTVTLRKPIDVKEIEYPVEGVRAFACSGTPVDCVRVGSLAIMPSKPDMVLAGINYGCNVATDIPYSATAGAAFEAAFQGFHAIALSEMADECHEITDAYLRDLLAEYLEYELGKDQIVNINFPGGKLADCRGILRNVRTSQEAYFHDRYNLVEEKEDGTKSYMVEGIRNYVAEEGTDFQAILDGYVAVGIVDNIK